MLRRGNGARTARKIYDVLVVGGEHARCEAATVAARMGASVSLLTHKRRMIGALSCNTSIGGVGKGHLVREVDPLDGVMERAADAGAIQFRTLNSRTGLAVDGTRAQICRSINKEAIDDLLEAHRVLNVLEGAAENVVFDSASVAGVVTAVGEVIRSNSFVLTSGTFLNVVLHVGATRTQGARIGDNAAIGIATALRSCGIKLGG